MALIENATIYNHYTQPAITSGLTTNNQLHFNLNNLPLTIYSGALHYFRIPRKYWRDRLQKLKAAGLNTVETYVPWNLHEPAPGVYDFGNGGSDFENFLDVAEFLKLVQEEDLLAIVRPGPYICSEWDFGGLPSWLLKDPDVNIRRDNPTFLDYVRKYFNTLFKILTFLQFTKGGPIIAFQVENEYGNVKVDGEEIDQAYLRKLVEIFKENGIVELLFTSDTPSNGAQGAIPGILNTANFMTGATEELQILRSIQKDKPLMVMEFWSGWFDHWGEKHHTIDVAQFSQELENIFQFPSSVNFYMFHGGTNWGFMNGANILEKGVDKGLVAFDTSSYDYDCPLTESGDYTEKYHALKRLIAKYNTLKIKLPDMPPESSKITHGDLTAIKMLKLSNYIKFFEVKTTHDLQPMEYFDQSYGYVVYSKTLDIPKNSTLRFSDKVRDTVMVLIDGRLINQPFKKRKDLDGFGYWKVENSCIQLTDVDLKNVRLDLIVENFGRVNYGKLHQFNQYRGLSGGVFINDKNIFNWEVVNLSFSKDLNTGLIEDLKGKWENLCEYIGPALYKFQLSVPASEIGEANNLVDSFIDMSAWNKGIVIVNGFVLSRYFKLGPQQTCYLPGALLKEGKNDIIIFEHFASSGRLVFSDKPKFGTLE